jgi:hypothetical protein
MYQIDRAWFKKRSRSALVKFSDKSLIMNTQNIKAGLKKIGELPFFTGKLSAGLEFGRSIVLPMP